MTTYSNNVICMKWGDKYSADYVNILFNMVSRNLNKPFKFVCFTDDPIGIDPRVHILDLPSLNLPNNIPERGWLKLTTFSKNLADLQGQALFLDLDVIVTGSLDELFEIEGEFFIIKDFIRRDLTGNSSVYRFEIGKHEDVLTYFKNNFDEIKSKHRNEQEFLSSFMNKKNKLSYWPEDWCKSFKKHCIHKGLKQFFYPPQLPAKAKIIIFHGKPNPPDALKGKSGKWYRKVLPTPWVETYWK
tara:strand:- start:1606 stop:2334 length:729 start_codon:yes stop_codon:yes gene_type:complete